jgi:hypothetical protein
MNFGKLGKGIAKVSPKTLKLEKYINLSTFPANVPGALDWSKKEGKSLVYDMLGNDIYGDCVFASACHQIGTWTGQKDVQQAILTEDALDAYHRFTGFTPDNPNTDNGAYMLDVANRWVSEPIADRTIKAFVSIDKMEPELVMAGAFICGGLWTGWALPIAWQTADDWDAGPSVTGNYAWGSWGGHAMHMPLVSPKMMGTRTWGGKKAITWNGFWAYCDEVYGIIPNDIWATLESNCPAGLDLEALANDIKLLK